MTNNVMTQYVINNLQQIMSQYDMTNSDINLLVDNYKYLYINLYIIYK